MKIVFSNYRKILNVLYYRKICNSNDVLGKINIISKCLIIDIQLKHTMQIITNSIAFK